MSAIEDHSRTTDVTDRRFFDVTAEVAEGRATLRPYGEVDIATAPAVERRASAIWDEGADMLVLDLSAVTFFDSSGLRLLIRLQTLADEHPRRSFALADCSPPVRRVLELTKLDSRFVFVD